MAAATSNLDELQSEIFELQQVVASEPELELALSSNQASNEQKSALVSKLVAGKYSASAELLAIQAVSSHAVKRFAAVLEQYGIWLAEVAGESVAHIKVARELSAEQLSRLGNALASAFGRKLQLNVEVSKDVIGGVHVAVNGEVIDATVLTKLNQARLQLN